MFIADNLEHIRLQIAEAAFRSGRPAEAVRLVAVSKTRTPAEVDEAFCAGQTLFGENYVQEFASKADRVTTPAQWHFIGHLQSNKVRQIAGLVAMIHSVDRLSLAQEIDRQWEKIGKCCDILIQVNISGEGSKSGTTASDALSLVKDVASFRHLRICGLMTMPPFFDEPERARPFFRGLRELADIISRMNIPGVYMNELSMGMSGDFMVAIEEGATLVRIGSALFGER
jgi:pyridoxal phosphate enzyme (YggS family)